MMKLVLLFAVACSSTSIPERTASERLKKVRLEAMAAGARAESFDTTRMLVERTYDRWFTPAFQARVLKSNPADIGALLEASNIVASYTFKPSHTKQVLAAYDALGKRVTDEQRALVRSNLVRARVWDTRHPELLLPKVIDATENRIPTSIVAVGDKYERRWLSLSNAQIIVIGAPDCHFAQRAMADIASDRELSPLFSSARTHWLAPQEAIADLEILRGTPYTVAYDRAEFPMIDTWELPAFYFMVDGVVRRKVVGWPEGGNLGALQEAALSLELVTVDRWQPTNNTPIFR